MSHLLTLMPRVFADQVLPLLQSLLPGVEYTCVYSSAPNDMVQEGLRDATILLTTGVRITGELMAGATNLRLIQKWGAGLDEIDCNSANALGIAVRNTPGANADSVAEHCFALLLTLSRRILDGTLALRCGIWNQANLITCGLDDLSGKTIGLVGFGYIGKAIAKRADAFQMRVIYCRKHNPEVPPECGSILHTATEPFQQLLADSDIIVAALPLTPETWQMFNAEAFSLMKRSAIFINVSRGQIVDEDALYHALSNNLIQSAATDVFVHESPFQKSRLLDLPNFVATPHIAGRSKGAIAAITRACVSSISGYL